MRQWAERIWRSYAHKGKLFLEVERHGVEEMREE